MSLAEQRLRIRFLHEAYWQREAFAQEHAAKVQQALDAALARAEFLMEKLEDAEGRAAKLAVFKEDAAFHEGRSYEERRSSSRGGWGERCWHG